VLHEIDDALVRLLRQELGKEGVPGDVSITVGDPPDERPENPQLNLFLHDVVENVARRDQSFEVRPGADLWTVGKSRRPTRVDASYLLSAHAADAATEHRMLGAALRILLRNQYVPPALLGESLAVFGDEALTLMVAQRDGWAHRELTAIWQAAGRRLRPAIGIVATAMVDPFETKTVRLVREAVIGLAQGVPAEGAARQMDLRSLRVSAAGRVVDAKSGEPLAGAQMFADDAPIGVSDALGVFLARDLAPGRRSLRIEAPGYTAWESEIDVSPPLRGGALEPVEVRLRTAEHSVALPGSKITGVLRHADGRPAAFIPLSLNGRLAVTDDQGRYVFELESAESPHILVPDAANLSS